MLKISNICIFFQLKIILEENRESLRNSIFQIGIFNIKYLFKTEGDNFQ